MSYLAGGVDGGCLLVFLRSWHDIGEGAAPPWLRGSVCVTPHPPPLPPMGQVHTLWVVSGGCVKHVQVAEGGGGGQACRLRLSWGLGLGIAWA